MGNGAQHGIGSCFLWDCERGHTRLDDPGLFSSDLRYVITEHIHVVQTCSRRQNMTVKLGGGKGDEAV